MMTLKFACGCTLEVPGGGMTTKKKHEHEAVCEKYHAIRDANRAENLVHNLRYSGCAMRRSRRESISFSAMRDRIRDQ